MIVPVVAATVFGVMLGVLRLLTSSLQSRTRLAAENLFLRKQLALYIERKRKPRRASNATRLTLVALAQFIEWRPLLTIVQPTPSCAGTGTPFVYSGAGGLVRAAGRRSQRTCSN